MLYLEAPVGVGFSYARDGNVITDDDIVSCNARRFPCIGTYHDRDSSLVPSNSIV